MSKVVRGKLSRASGKVTLEVRVIDIQTGFLDLSFEGSRPAGDLIALQNDLAIELLQKLGIDVSDQRRQMLLASRTNDSADSVKLLSETLSDFSGERGPDASLSIRRHLASLLRWRVVAPALAADGADEEAIRQVVKQYGAAIQAKDMDQLARVLVDLNNQQRSAHQRYFESAEDLAVEISDLDVLIDGDEALVTFTRKDSFKETKSGRDRTLEVRLNSLMKREDGAWKIASFTK
jgi:ketosteroid isomerase-like protein